MAFTFVTNNHVGTTVTAGAVNSAPFTLAGVTAGHLLVLGVELIGNGSLVSIADGNGSSWAIHPFTAVDTTAVPSIRTQLCSCLSAVAGTASVTVTFTGTTNGDFVDGNIDEFSYTGGACTYDTGSANWNSNSANPDPGNVTVFGAGELGVVFGGSAGSSFSGTNGAGYTVTSGMGSFYFGGRQYNVSLGSGSVSGAFNNASVADWVCSFGTWKVGGGVDTLMGQATL